MSGLKYVDDADLAGHIRTVTEFLRNLCDTVDGPDKSCYRGEYAKNTSQGKFCPKTGHLQLFSEIGLMYVASKLGFEWTQVALALGTTQPEIEQIQLDNPYQTTRQIIVVLIRWRDRQMNRSQEESIRQLVRALEIPERQDLIDDLRKKYNLPVDMYNNLPSLSGQNFCFFNKDNFTTIKIFYDLLSEQYP
ncbi:hypothetical protein AM593_04270, partial [Mytilus galloprovincialis]